MMKNSLLLLAIIPIIFTIGYLFAQPQDSLSQSQTEGITGKGVYTIYVKDSVGVTTAIRQSENAVMNTGENCIAKLLFKDPDATGTTVCTGANTQAWRYMGLDEDPQILLIDKDLRDQADETGLATLQKSSITWNQNSTASTDALSKVTIRMSYTFTNSGASSETIYAVGLFNDTGKDTRSMLSKANFTSVDVGAGSDITVNYDYEIGGGTVP